MKVTLSPAKLQINRVNDLILREGALIFDVDGTLAETEDVHRQAFNQSFVEVGIDWCWSRAIYKELLRLAGGKERIRAFDCTREKEPMLSDSEIAKLHGIESRAPDACSPGKAESHQVPVPVIVLPLGATEDRVVGALDLEGALAHGKRTFEPGLLEWPLQLFRVGLPLQRRRDEVLLA
jgi:hypothetical protein